MAAFVVFVALVVALAVWAARDRALEPVRWDVVSWSVRGDSAVFLTFHVDLHGAGTAVCTLRARNVVFTEVGRVDRRIGPLPGNSGVVTAVIPTSERAVDAGVLGCAPAA